MVSFIPERIISSMSSFNQIEYQNTYNKEKYDRLSIMLEKGKKVSVQQRAASLDKSINAYVNFLINTDLQTARPRSKTDFFSINNRRYLGNKYRLLDFITSVVKQEEIRFDTFTDIFAGTGAVAYAFRGKKLITNDILYSNYITHIAWFGNERFSMQKIQGIIDRYNNTVCHKDNYMSDTFSDTYFSRDDCRKIGYIREDIEDLYSSGDINERERALLITSLLYAMDKIAKTCGHYDAYRKGVSFDEHLVLKIPNASNDNKDNLCFNEDALALAKDMRHDIVYMDPPYNSRQYSDAYHLLENVARWEKPAVSGVALKMDRSQLKSDFCTSKAPQAMKELVDALDTRYILLSYNNMGKKGNDRSNAKISDDEIMDILSSKGKVSVFTEDYRAFSAGKSSISDNKERLFLCRVKD